MAAPALKDLPKVAVDLKSQLESFSPGQLKNASTEEKALLPTAEGKLTRQLSPIKRDQIFMNQLSFVPNGSLIHIRIYINSFRRPKRGITNSFHFHKFLFSNSVIFHHRIDSIPVSTTTL